MSFGQAIARFRALACVHPMTVSRWERGTVNVPEPIAKLLRLLVKTAPKARS